MGIFSIYITMMPLIFGGVFNMVFTKTKLYKNHNKAIDCGKCLSDGKRIFGDNKTFIGFISMIVFCIISQVVWGIFCNIVGIEKFNELYLVCENTIWFNIIVGFLFGFVYMLCELPNSFIKRRIDIEAGKTDKGLKGLSFFIIDQIDSLLGVFLVLWAFNGMSFGRYMLYLGVGAITHICINLVLLRMKVRRNL